MKAGPQRDRALWDQRSAAIQRLYKEKIDEWNDPAGEPEKR